MPCLRKAGLTCMSARREPIDNHRCCKNKCGYGDLKLSTCNSPKMKHCHMLIVTQILDAFSHSPLRWFLLESMHRCIALPGNDNARLPSKLMDVLGRNFRQAIAELRRRH